jgi:alcohol dehydrogenase class IV
MFTYLTSGQIIIGLKSLHPIKRMIKEKHFKKALLVFSNDRNSMYHLGDLRRYLKHIKVPYEIIAADLRRDSIDVTDDIDLIISIGVRHVHDIAKISNRNHVALYCIESIPGHMSSYGTGCI